MNTKNLQLKNDKLKSAWIPKENIEEIYNQLQDLLNNDDDYKFPTDIKVESISLWWIADIVVTKYGVCFFRKNDDPSINKKLTIICKLKSDGKIFKLTDHKNKEFDIIVKNYGSSLHKLIAHQIELEKTTINEISDKI